MYLQLLIIVLVYIYSKILTHVSSSSKINSDSNRLKLCTFSGILLILQSGLRNLAVGADTYAYFIKFDYAVNTSWSTIIAYFKEVYVYGEGKDAGYLVFEKLCAYISSNFQVFLLIIALIFFIPLMYVIYRNTTKLYHIVYAIIVYEALFYSFFSITGCRQTVATGFCLLAFEQVRNRNFWIFVLLIAAGAFIHKSCLIFLPFYWIGNIKKPRWIFAGSLFLFPVMLLIGRKFTLQLALLSGSDNYLGYAEHEAKGAILFSAFYIFIAIFGFLLYKKNKQFFIYKSAVVNAVSLGLFFLPLTFVSAALMRIVQYFSIYLVIYVNYLHVNMQLKRNSIIFTLIICLLFFKIIIGMSRYAFFWEYMSLGHNYI